MFNNKQDYDEFDEERDLMKTNTTEFGDRLSKSGICGEILFWVCVGGLITCACIRGCQEIKKSATDMSSARVMNAQHTR